MKFVTFITFLEDKRREKDGVEEGTNGESVSMEPCRNGEDRDRVEAEVLGTLTAGIVNLEKPLPHLPSPCQGKLITSTSDLQQGTAPALANVTPCLCCRTMQETCHILAEHTCERRAFPITLIHTALREEFSFVV